MTTEAARLPPGQRFRLSSPPDARLFLAASMLAVFGVLLLMFWGFRGGGGTVLLVAALVALPVAGVLTAVALVRSRRATTVVVLGREEVSVLRAGRTQRTALAAVTGLQTEPGRVVLERADGPAVVVRRVDRRSSATFDRLTAALSAALAATQERR